MKRFCCSGTSKKNEDDLKTAKRLKTGPGHYRNVEVTVGIKQRWKCKPCIFAEIIYFSPHQRRTAFNVFPPVGFKFLLKMCAAGSAGSFASSVSVFQSAIPAISRGPSDGEMSAGQA